MNRNKKRVHLPVLLVLFFALTFPSCIDEDRSDCADVSIGFDYSHNILSSNAFAAQVDQVMLYVFDNDGILVMKEKSGDVQITNDYAVRTNKLSSGKYKFVAWGQSNHITGDEAFFEIPELTVGVSALDDLSYFLRRNDGVQQHELNNLLVGLTEMEITNKSATQYVRVKLKKVNNKIRIVMLPFGTENNGLDINNYTLSVVDNIGNGHVNYDYSLLQDEAITYRPYYAANIEPNPSEVLNPNEIRRAAVAEINTSRLMDREIKADNPRLIITSKADEREIVSINLPWFFSLTGMESHKDWSLQEYLDRQDEYVITLFIQDGAWMQAAIIINGWVINNVSIDV